MARILDRTMALDLARLTAGSFFFLLGILGLFLPILQGILFLTIAAVLLAPYIPVFHRFKLYLYRRFPGVRHQIQRFKRALHRRFPFTRPRPTDPALPASR